MTPAHRERQAAEQLKPYDDVRGRAITRVSPVSAAKVAVAGARFYLTAMFILLASLPAMAQNGGTPGRFLNFGVGGRAMAMGGAYYGISDDATAAYWNPAGLAQVQRKELTTMQATLFLQTKLTYFSYAHPTKGGSTFALSMTQLAGRRFRWIVRCPKGSRTKGKQVATNLQRKVRNVAYVPTDAWLFGKPRGYNLASL
jgi:hypothetical protein